jgi:hypothetical protein
LFTVGFQSVEDSRQELTASQQIPKDHAQHTGVCHDFQVFAPDGLAWLPPQRVDYPGVGDFQDAMLCVLPDKPVGGLARAPRFDWFGFARHTRYRACASREIQKISSCPLYSSTNTTIIQNICSVVKQVFWKDAWLRKDTTSKQVLSGRPLE